MTPLAKIGIGIGAGLVAVVVFLSMGPLAKLALMATAAFVLFVVMPEWRRRTALEQLRKNPVPLVWVEVCLPRNAFKDANKRMQNFCRKLQASLGSSSEDLRNGTGQLHVLTIAHVPEHHTRPELRWLLGCEQKLLTTLERQLGNAFGNMADIREPDEDVLAAIIDVARRELARDDDEQPR